MPASVIVWDIETIPDLKGFAAAIVECANAALGPTKQRSRFSPP
jgi:hypothetical protein